MRPRSSAYTISGIDDETLYYVWVFATDGTNVAGPVLVGSAATPDSTDPLISNFDVTQTTSYTFTASVGTIADNAAGPLKVYLVMATTPMNTDDLVLIHESVESIAKNESVPYTVGAVLNISSIGLSTTEYWTGSAFESISVSAPASRHQLYAHLFVLDANNNKNSSTNNGVAKTVADATPPRFSGAVTLTSVSTDSLTVSWSAGFADDRAIASATVYYSTSAPTSYAAIDIAAWKAAATTYNLALPVAQLSVAGDATAGSLVAATTYYAYLCVLDAAGNSLDVATVPESITISSSGVETPTFSTVTSYVYTGADQVVPVVGGEVMRVKMWGAGGRNRYGNAPGGAGGFSEAIIKIPAGVSSMVVMVGSTGSSGPGQPGVYGGGGALGTDRNGKGGGGGGGRSAVRIQVNGATEDIVTAGGGGGGGERNGGQYAGAGGGLQATPSFNSPASAGTQTSGGVCVDQNGSGNTSGVKYNGGAATSGYTGGSGGGGYYGGAGAGGPGNYQHKAGGGGSGYVGLDGVTALTGQERGSATEHADTEAPRTDSLSGVIYHTTRCLRGSGTNPPMTTDIHYDGRAGQAGASGLVVIERV